MEKPCKALVQKGSEFSWSGFEPGFDPFLTEQVRKSSNFSFGRSHEEK